MTDKERVIQVFKDQLKLCGQDRWWVTMTADDSKRIVDWLEESNRQADAVCALSNPNYEYYRLTRDIGDLKAGAIFYHDPDDHVYGSMAEGCLKLCWTPTGNCYSDLCGGTVILHCSFARTSIFEKIEPCINNVAQILKPGHYMLTVNEDGSYQALKCGERV